VVGDSQVKYLTKQRLHLPSKWRVCTWSLKGADIGVLRSKIGDLLHIRVGALVLCVGGNDLKNIVREPVTGSHRYVVANRLLDFAGYCAEFVADQVYIIGVLPRSSSNEDNSNHRRMCSLVKSLYKKRSAKAPFDRVVYMPVQRLCVRDKGKVVDGILGADGYHLHGDKGIRLVAKVVRGNLTGEWQEVEEGRSSPKKPSVCWRCKAFGHKYPECRSFRRGGNAITA
jgi:hypothetical protein